MGAQGQLRFKLWLRVVFAFVGRLTIHRVPQLVAHEGTNGRPPCSV